MAKNKHLTLNNRYDIEKYLNNNFNFTEIGRLLGKSDRTISSEVKKRKVRIKKKNVFHNAQNYICPILLKPPYVCNSCDTKHSCRKTRYEYYAKDADALYRNTLVNSRIGIDMEADEFHRLNHIISEDIAKGHSFAMIVNNHKNEIGCSEQTLYNYLSKGYLDVINLDMPRLVRYKKRKKKDKNEPKPRKSKCREGRTYNDYLTFKEDYFIKNGFDFDTVQMDTVEGKKGDEESVLLTLLWTQSNFILAFKMEEKTMECVTKVFDNLKVTLGLELFYQMFPVILTDNGSEFSDPDSIENNGLVVEQTKIFYCDPRASQQKAKIEVTHEYIRRYIPKGVSFNQYSQEQIILMINHINSTPREMFEWFPPYDVISIFAPEEFFEELDLERIDEWNVILKTDLLDTKKEGTTTNSTK